MPSYRLRKGLHLLLLGIEYVIEERLPNNDLRIREITTNICRPIKEEDLVDALFDGNLELLSDGGNGSHRELKRTKLFFEDLSLLDDSPKNRNRKKETKRRYKYVSEVIGAGLTKLAEASLKPIKTKVSKEINDDAPPSDRTIRRWFKLYMISGEDIRVLIPAYHKRGNTTRKFGYRDRRNFPNKNDRKFEKDDEERAKEASKIIDDVINEEYLSETRPSVETIFDTIEARVIKINKRRDQDDQLPIPVRSSVYEVVNKMPEYERDAARYGKMFADRKHMTVLQGPRPKRPLERVEMDDTKLDLFVIDSDRGMPIGRPTIFTLIDVCTKMPTGLNVSFHAPSYLSVMQCLMHSIKKKDHIKERYPEIENEWRCYGVPDLIVVDNAKQYYSESFEDAAVQLNFIIDYAPVRVPWYKASIERYFGTLNRQLLHHQPGTSFSNIFDKGDYDPKKNAVISFETFLKIIHVFIIDIYSREEHDYDGFPDVPSRRWDEWIKEFPPSLPSTVADLKVLIGQIEWRVISPNGVELFGLFYNSEELAPLRSRLKGTKAKIKLDPNDLSVVYVADIERGRYIPVPAKNQHYTEGLTLFQHDVIRRHARQMVKDYVNIEALCRAKELIKKIVRREWEESKKTDTRVRMARFLNYGWQAHDGGIEAQADGNEGNNNRIEQQNELPRLHCDASSGKAESDIGSAFPISEVLNEGDGEYGNAQISGAIEVKQEANNGRSQTKPSKSTAEKSKRVSKQNELRNDGESNFVNSSISYNKDVPHDETKWGSEYE